MTNIIKIPDVFEQILSTEPKLHGAVQLTLSAFHPWLRTSGMPFFPGYTDHSDRHISEVLDAASAIITDEARRLLTPADITVLVLSVLLHDSGMHLTADGFRNLVDSSAQPPPLEGFGDESWPQIWREFISEASRFDGRKLTSIFGDNPPVAPHKIDIKNLTEQDHLLIGEFMRRHHARLAHEIALWGVPGPGPLEQRLSFSQIPHDLADLAGLVARSHNLPLRATYAYLEDNYDLRDFKGVHAIFLMAVLRIADYIQVRSERAEKELLKVKQLRSPISKREWLAHDAIRNIQTTHDDPEALHINALPKDIHTYIKLKHLLKDIQAEIDNTWASLGEIYGRYGKLEKFGLTIRRIRSNLENTKNFERKIKYIPVEVSFESAGTDLLKLLVGPLYGDDPGVGIRELIQNAADACRELADWKKTHPEQTWLHETAQEAGIIVEFEERPDKSRWLTISDTGIGMTLDVIRNYFLRAGASFRTSDSWRRQHEDEHGRSRVLRGGRFGVGALAAFLIGDEIHVTTRHATIPEDQAIEFKASLDASALELHHTQAPIGTTIRIHITSDDIWNDLLPPELDPERDLEFDLDDNDWESVDWYCLQTPPIIIKTTTPKGSATLRPRYQLPLPHSKLPIAWHRIEDNDYDDIQWTFDRAPALTCNGIIVSEHILEDDLDTLWADKNSPIKLTRPKLSVFDTQGIFPLNLQRTSLAARSLSFDSKIINSLARDFIAFTLVYAPAQKPNEGKFTAAATRLFKYPGLSFLGGSLASSGDIRFEPFLITRNGVVLFDKSPMVSLGIRRIWAMPRVRSFSVETIETLPTDTAIAFLNIPGAISSRFSWLDQAIEQGLTQGLDFLEVTHIRLSMPQDDLEEIQSVSPERFTNFKTEHKKGALVFLGKKNSITTDIRGFTKAAYEQRHRKPAWLFEWSLSEKIWTDTSKPSPLANAWMEFLPSCVIPYDLDLRRQILNNAYAALAPLIESHEQLLKMDLIANKKQPA